MRHAGDKGLASVAAWALTLFGLTGLGALCLVLAGQNYREFSPAILVIAYSPTLAALFAAWAFSGRRGAYALLRQIWTWRVGLHWYALVIVGPVVLVVLANILYVAFGGEAPARWLAWPALSLGPLIGGPLGQEFGWRGFAQPRLQERYGALLASVAIGILWSIWHYWPVLTPAGFADFAAADLVQGFVRLISTAIIYAWLLNSTGSLFLVMVAHAAHDVAVEVVPLTEETALVAALLYLAAAVAVVCATRPQTLSRAATTVRAAK